MYKTIEGIYDNGVIKPLEEINTDKKRFRVMIILLTDESEEELAEMEKELEAKDDTRALGVRKLTLDYLNGKLQRKGSIKEIQIDSEAIQNAIAQTFGTTDPIELINLIRR